MKATKVLFLAMFFVLGLSFLGIGNHYVLADDDYDYDHEYYNQDYERDHGHHGKEKDGPFEEVGELTGWGTIIAMGTAAVIFPMRRSLKTVITKVPSAKDMFISVTKFFGKYHVSIGIAALVLSIVHGVLMFLAEGKLDGDGRIGLVSALLMLIAGILGVFLLKNKKLQSIRTTHTVLIAFSLLVGIVHIAGA